MVYKVCFPLLSIMIRFPNEVYIGLDKAISNFLSRTFKEILSQKLNNFQEEYTKEGYDYRIWSIDDDYYLTQNWDRLPIREILKYLNRTPAAVIRRLYELGLVVPRKEIKILNRTQTDRKELCLDIEKLKKEDTYWYGIKTISKEQIEKEYKMTWFDNPLKYLYLREEKGASLSPNYQIRKKTERHSYQGLTYSPFIIGRGYKKGSSFFGREGYTHIQFWLKGYDCGGSLYDRVRLVRGNYGWISHNAIFAPCEAVHFII